MKTEDRLAADSACADQVERVRFEWGDDVEFTKVMLERSGALAPVSWMRAWAIVHQYEPKEG